MEEQILERLESLGVSIKCPECGHSDTEVYVDRRDQPALFWLSSGVQGIEMVGLSCPNCGNIRMFDARTFADHLGVKE